MIACGGSDPIAPESPVAVPLDQLSFEWLNRSPQGDQLLASAASGAMRMLVGNGGAVVVKRSDVPDWKRIQAPTRRALTDVVLLSASHAIASGEDGVLESRDGGENWAFLHRSPTTPMLTLAVRGNIIVAGGVGSILVSTDSGGEFKATDVGSFTKVLGLAFLADKTILAAQSNGRLLISTDAGGSWEPVDNEPILGVIVAMDFPTASRGTIITRNPDRAYFSSDGGANWSVAQEFPATVRALDFFDGSRGLTITDLGALFLTENDGKSWAFQQDRVLVTQNTIFHTLLAVGEDERIVAGQAGFLAETTNGGFFWQEKSSGSREVLHELEFPSPQRGFALIGSRLQQSTDAGASWQEVGFSFANGMDMDFLDASQGLMMSHGGKLFHTEDGGQNWLRKGNPGNSIDDDFEGVCMIDADRWVIVGNHNMIQLTVDQGVSYAGSLNRQSNFHHLDVAFFPGTETGLIVGFDHFLRSVDGGVSWQPMADPPGGREIHCIDANTAVVVGGGIHLTVNAGLNWTKVAETGAEQLHAVDFASTRRGLAVGDAGLVLQTLDGGRSWVETLTTGSYLFATSFRDEDTALIGGEDGALLRGDPELQ